MLQKVHRKFTLLCTLLILLVLTVMTLFFLAVSENNLKENNMSSFNNDINIILSNIEMTQVMTRDWIHSLQYNGKYTISILDNGVELWIVNPMNKPEKSALFREMYDIHTDRIHSREEGDVLPAFPDTFFYTSALTGIQYLAYIDMIEKNDGNLNVSVLYSLEDLRKQILRQRIWFFVIDLLAIAVLSLFASFFTRKILEPVEKSQLEQVRFVAAASHELRTPLAVILSANNACRTAGPGEQETFRHTIDTEGGRMSRLITDMLTLARADSRSWTIRKEPAGLDTILLNSYESFETLANEKNIRLSITIPEEELPPCLCDADRICQVITILLHNALSYTQNGGRIHIGMKNKEKYLQFYVSDNGPGISDDEKPKIFERFYRIDSSRSNKDHFGLGLCIAWEIMQAHHGTIKVIDTPGGGSTFICRLPI